MLLFFAINTYIIMKGGYLMADLTEDQKEFIMRVRNDFMKLVNELSELDKKYEEKA
jgi:hypothetical protein